MNLTATQNVTVLNLTATQSGTSVALQPVINIGGTGGGGGDMTAAVYDPTSVVGDAFAMDNMVEGADTKILTASERSAITTNSAKVSFPEAPNDGTQYARKNLGWEAVALSGGTEYQHYESKFSIDSSNVLQWMTAQSTTVVSQDYSVTSLVALTDSPTTILPSTLRIKTFLGVAKANQTVESLTLSCISIINEEWTHISIFKVKHDVNFGFVYATELYTNRALAFTANPILRTITIPAASFDVTSIADGDIIYIAIGASSLNDILPCEVYLKCSID